ncbi:LLM class flavin-dependent oxidoreductase [Nocardioides mangrovi]|uniref:LLM class flavin-dependent oxidoreductase n=1 Tax=Nocardioides mangrovi TaxID=2874580 RepID=A0ABS7UFN6_9ACTN|nr:LLM class flavin-dependent oxidoreductase [Nocardioides mangrovi]MBZ5739506.1 LLM class flavin-dependent oxidoreductase [Nocardioides mangrovi]
MRAGVALQPVYPSQQFGDMVADAEAWGLDELWLTDSSLHSRYCYSFLTIAALRTSRMTLGTAVTNPVTRHPALGAVAAATINEVSGGRAIHGIGAGDRPLEALGFKPARLGLLEDAVAASRRLWSGETVSWEARGFSLDDAHMRFDVPSEIPVYISASGPKTLELAGRIADGVILLAGLHPDGLRYALEHIDRGVEMAGRDRRPQITVFAYGQISDDDESALAAARTIAAWFPQTAPMYCELAGLSPELVERVRTMYSGGEFQEAEAAARLLPEDFVRRMALAGGADVVLEHRRNLAELGIDSMTVFPIGGDVESRIATVRAYADIVRSEP